MTYDPKRHHRRSTRLRGWDYSRPAVYFVTLCTHHRLRLFGSVRRGVMHLNAYGKIVDAAWGRSETLRAEITLDAYVVMPNHVHGLVLIVPPDAPDGLDPADPRGYQPGWLPTEATRLGPTVLRRPPRSLGSFVAGFKTDATKRINALRGTPGRPVWQYKFHDRIVRTEREWRTVRRYIINNPAQWTRDRA